MSKILEVARRELFATVATKGFIIGVLLTPGLIALMLVLMPVLTLEEAPPVEGEVAVVDPTGKVFPALGAYLEPEAIARRRRGFGELVPETGGNVLAERAIATILGDVPKLQVRRLEADSPLEEEKKELLAEQGQRLALVVVHDDAVAPSPPGGELGTYDLFVRDKLDDRVEREIRTGVREAIVSARLRSRGLDPDEIDALTRVSYRRSTAVTREGERATLQMFHLVLPMAFMFLLMMSVMVSGQYLMTTTIEEKASRVVEILLSAVSPKELMAGKILGQFCVGLIILALYGGIAFAALVSFSLLGYLEPPLVFYLIAFFVITYLLVASMMAAIGAAVNELREAQTLLTPVMLVLMFPWLLWLPISRNPDSLLAVATSFLPPVNAFAMLLRMTGTSPPPWWQVWLSIAIGLAALYVVLTIAAKVFRIGLLMHGKPPGFRTLIRWVRMA